MKYIISFKGLAFGRAFLDLILFLLLVNARIGAAASLPLDKIKLPSGFKISIFAEVPDARSLAQSPDGTVFVGTMADKVYAFTDRNDDGKADQVFTIASGLNEPNGVAFKEDSLYVAEISQIRRFDHIEKDLAHPPKPILLNVKFPSDKHHGWKFIAIGPDNKLYVPVGAPCNVCKPDDDHAALFRIDLDGTHKERIATGIRNTVGFDWHPQLKILFFTENGRDLLGDDIPSDELNRLTKIGLDFGFPRCHAGDIVDPTFGRANDCTKAEKPIVKLGPHVAALGMRFYHGNQFPNVYKNNIFIAEHGSWNRTKPIGYQIVTVALNDQGMAQQPNPKIFASGWLDERTGEAWGRPVDVLERADGSLLISDDKAGVIYRITYGGAKSI